MRRLPVCIMILAVLSPVPAAASELEAVERHLDPLLKILYRAQLKTSSVHPPPHEGGPDELRVAMEPSRVLEAIQLVQSPVGAAPASFLKLLARFDGDMGELERNGFIVQSHLGPVVTGVLPPERLSDLARLPGLAYLQLSRPLRASWQPLRGGFLRAPPHIGPESIIKIAASGSSRESGSGTLIGIVDTGVDIRHGDFRKDDGTTRIRYLLDLSDPGDMNGDGLLDGLDDFGGTLYTQTEINEALAGNGWVRQRDSTGHGTHALSVAAGDDPESPGIAPDADLIVVKATRQDGTLDFESVDILHALAFIDTKAHDLGLPYVVNLSMGSLFSSHDGRSLEEIAIDSLVGAGIPGKAVVVAAGNAADHRSGRYRHFQGTAFAGAEVNHTLVIPPYSQPNPGIGDDRILLDLWYEGGDRLSIAVTAPDGVTRAEAHAGEITDLSTPFGHIFIANMGGTNPLNGDTEALVLIYDRSGPVPAAGEWELSVSGESIEAGGVYHAWLVDNVAQVGEVEPYFSTGDDRYLVAKPGTAYNAITVGSFARHVLDSRFRTSWTDARGVLRLDPSALQEDISGFSAAGPTRDGRLKPELAAPGEAVIGAMSIDAHPDISPVSVYRDHGFSAPDALVLSEEPDRGFGILQGTSFSAPVVTGQVARILAVHPGLDAIQVRNVLINAALADTWTGSVPNPLWGYGKIASADVVPHGSLPETLRIDADALPTGWKDRPYNFVLTATGGALPYTWTLVEGALPPGLALAQGSFLTGTPLAAAQVDLTFEVKDASVPQQTRRRTFRLIIGNTSPLEIVTTYLQPGLVGRLYEEALEARGGAPPYEWSLAHGTLPAGISLAADGSLQGTPAALSEPSFTVAVRDAFGTSAWRSFTFRVMDGVRGQWRSVGGAVGSAVTMIALDPSSRDHLYARVTGFPYEHIVSESVDGGQTWRNISVNNGLWRGAKLIRVNPVTSELWAVDSVFAAPRRYDSKANLWRAWSGCFSGNFPAAISPSTLDIRFDGLGRIFLLPYEVDCPLSPERNGLRGFLRSQDDGATWENIGSFPLSARGYFPFGSLSVFQADSRYMYAGHGQACFSCGEPLVEGFYRSQDGGATWQDLGVGVETVISVLVSQTDPFDVIRLPWNPYDYPGQSVFEVSSTGGSTWESRFLPGNLRICLLERSESQPSILLAGTTAGVFKSEDGGRSWYQLYLQGRTPDLCTGVSWEANNRVGSLAIDSKDPLRMFVGTSEAVIYATEDGGRLWKVLGDGLLSRMLSGVAISKSRPEDMMTIAAVPYISRNGGDRWILSANGAQGGATGYFNERYGYPMISPQNADLYFFVDRNHNLFRSEDRGLSWTQLSPVYIPKNGVSGGPYSFVSIAPDPFDANILMARLSLPFQSGTAAGIWRSEDRGETWRQVAEVDPPPTHFFSHPEWEPQVAFADDVEGRVYALGPEGLYRSEDRGDSWNLVAALPAVFSGSQMVVEPAPSDSSFLYVIRENYVHAVDLVSGTVRTTTMVSRPVSLAVDQSDPNTAYLGLWYTSSAITSDWHGGVFATRNGGRTWSRLESFPSNLSVMSLVSHPTISGTVYAATKEDGIYRTSNGGLNWEKLDQFEAVADVANIAVRDPLNPLALFVGTQGFGVQVSTNGGGTFIPRAKGLGNLNVRSLAFDTDDPRILYAGTEQGLFKTSNAGLNWQSTGLAEGLVTDLEVDTGSRPRRIRLVSYHRGMGISADQGTSFEMKSVGLTSLDLTSVATELTSTGLRTWVTMRGGDGVAYSDDDGGTWHSAAGSGLSDRNVNDLAIQPGGHLWIATDSGVFFSDNVGLSWSHVAAGLPVGVPVTSLSMDPNTGEILVSLFSAERGGVYRGANLTGTWREFNDGLRELRVNRLTNDGGHILDAALRGTRFYASTAGEGLYEVEVESQEATAPSILTTQLSEGIENRDYREIASAGGGVPPYGWSLVAGSLPPGLSLDPSTGTISGRPAAAGHYPFTLQVVDARSRLAQRDLALLIIPAFSALTVERAGLGQGQVLSDPPGISCGSECQAIYPAGTLVRLFGAAAPGSSLSRWEGAEDCRDGVVEMKAAKTCRAVFVDVADKALDFYTLQPCRALDTRTGPPLMSQEIRVIQLVGKCGIPDSAQAVSVNVTVVGPTAAGHVGLWRADLSEPLSSVINLSAGRVRANNAILAISRDGQGSIAAKASVLGSGSVHLLIDVNGYFEWVPSQHEGSVR